MEPETLIFPWQISEASGFLIILGRADVNSKAVIYLRQISDKTWIGMDNELRPIGSIVVLSIIWPLRTAYGLSLPGLKAVSRGFN